MSVYFAREKKNGLIKIGTSIDPENRVKNIRSSFGPSVGKVELLNTIDGSYREEQFFQELLRKYHVRPSSHVKSREWFDPSDDVMYFVNSSKEWLDELINKWREIKEEYGDRVKFVFDGKNVIGKIDY